MSVPFLRIQRATAVWLLLLSITAVTAWLGGCQALGDDRYVSAAIVLLAFAKIRLVIVEFMELRHAPFWMRLAGESWVLVLATTILSLDLL